MASKYTSTLRAEQAAETRRRIVAAAADLFADDGYARTTLPRIAQRAGVSVETVQAQGSKRSLLTAAVHERTFSGPEQRFFEAPEARSTTEAETFGTFCRSGAELVGRFNAATFRIWRAFASAAADDAEVDREYAELALFVRGQCLEIVGVLSARGWLRTDVGTEELTDSLWLLTSNDTYDRATTRLGWTQSRYVDWLERSLIDLLTPCG